MIKKICDHLVSAFGNFSRLTKDVVLSNRPGYEQIPNGAQLIASANHDSAVFESGEKLR